MNSISTILFDLDDTLLDREQAIEKLFLVLLEKFYENIKHTNKNEMLRRFKEYDKKNYGINDKTRVLEPVFNEFPTKRIVSQYDMQGFWNTNLPLYFSVDETILEFLSSLKEQYQLAIITNGSTERQYAIISNTNLNNYFEEVFISEEVGFTKPDRRIFEVALNKLNIQPEHVLFIGDDLKKDIEGCQNANIKGIWFNPLSLENRTDIEPYAEIKSLKEILNYLS
ncbi:HAD-IA family hydrolase [Planococcus maritimus]|nr:HAD-IA family hydrolase [Planococcus sp. SK3692]MDE4083611.1 HAD-IA family hydrolase [Planococcus maritimus]